jgi:hypothetical protein
MLRPARNVEENCKPSVVPVALIALVAKSRALVQVRLAAGTFEGNYQLPTFSGLMHS